VDHRPYNTIEERQKLLQKAKTAREARERAATSIWDKNPVERARKNYLGDRAQVNRKPGLTGDLTKLAQ
jgi:hypothetical protein